MGLKQFGLPKEVGDGLLLRWATAADAEAVIEFNGHIHAAEGGNEELKAWVRDLISGRHPTTSIEDFTVVIDTEADNKIVSSLCTIPQTWSYGGIEFPVGRPELVGTLEAYRRRGLVRAQMDAIHAKGEARGELMQVITGIPWYYRKFGYEMAVDLGGGRRYVWERAGNLVHLTAEDEPYTWRQARSADIPLLQALYARHNRSSMIVTERSEEEWRYELTGHSEESLYLRHRWIIEHKQYGDVAYVQFAIWGENIVLHELGVKEGHSIRAVCLYLTRMFKGFAKQREEKEKKRISAVIFRFGVAHPSYEALGRQLEKLATPYAWYIRFPELETFLRKIRPVLEARLADSVMAGHSGDLQLDFYANGGLKLVFEEGKLIHLGRYVPKQVAEGDAHFPDLLFYQLVCGRRTLAELNSVYPDCFGSAEAEVLLGILFPKRPSQPIGLG